MSRAYYSESSRLIVESLKKDLGQGVLLSGPTGIGLHFAAHDIARAFTKEIVTLQPDAKGTISIDAVRDLYTLGRSKGAGSVFIIDDADAMGIEAQNALLKLLEEPIASLHFILTSHAPQRLLQTIRSRVTPFVLTPLSPAATNAMLDDLAITDATKRAQLGFIAAGLPAAIVRYTADEKGFTARSAIVRDARGFLQGSREERLVMSVKYKDRAQALGLISDVLKLLRRSVEASPSEAGTDAIDTVLSTEAALHENASVRLSLTHLALAL